MAEVPRGTLSPEESRNSSQDESLCSRLWWTAWKAIQAEAGDPTSWLNCRLQRRFADFKVHLPESPRDADAQRSGP